MEIDLCDSTAQPLVGVQRWRCAVMMMRRVMEVSQPMERRELGVPTKGLEQMAGVVKQRVATGSLM